MVTKSTSDMPSAVVETPLETPPAEERLPEILSGKESPTSTARGVGSRDGHKSAISSPRRNGIPPKRLSAVTKRAEARLSASTTKPQSTTRSSPPSGLSKPPARPMGASLGRRPVPGVATSTPSSLGHKLRPSTSSIEDLKKTGTSEGVENKRPGITGTAKRASLAPSLVTKATGLNPSSGRSTLSTSTAHDKNAMSSRSGVTSPTKASMRSATTTTRPSATPGTHRSSRPPPSSPKAIHGASSSETTKKRLSTIPASPACAVTSTFESERGSKPIRPGLGSRKSTMSITIEQRLREMELVSDMLMVAMAEDDGESDEVKEEYGRKVDEKLADLREQLEEARRKEDKPLIGSPAGLPTPRDTTDVPERRDQVAESDDLDGKRAEELLSTLTSSQEQVTMLEAEIESARTRMDQYSEDAAEASRDVELATENLRVEHASKIDEMVANHKTQLATICSQLGDVEAKYVQYVERSLKDIEAAKMIAAEQNSNDTIRLLSEQKIAHEAALQAMKDQFYAERTERADTLSNSATLAAEVSNLRYLLEEEIQHSENRLGNAQARFDSLLKEKENLIERKEKDMLDLHQEIEQLQRTHGRELEEAEAITSQHDLETQRTQMEARQEIRKLEANAAIASDEHGEVLRTKESEVSSMGQVIESLQDELQNLQERKDHEAENLRIRLIKEHDVNMSRTRAQHELALQAVHDEARDKSSTIMSDHEEELRHLKKSIKSANQDHNSALSNLNSKIVEMQQTVDSLQAEVLSANNAKSLIGKALEEASDELVSVKKGLETVDRDGLEKDGQHTSLISRMREEMDHTVKALQDKITEDTSISDGHAAEMESLRRSHAKELEKLKIEITENADLSFKELQAKWYLLQESLKNSDDNHTTSLDIMTNEHAAEIQASRASHKKELEELGESHRSQITQVANDVNIKAAETVAISEQKHRKLIEDLQQQHEIDIRTTRDGHQRILLELQDQVLQHRKDLANAENELQSSRESQASAERENQERCRKKLDALQSQLATAKSDARDARDELVSIGEGKGQLETSCREQSAELDELRTTLAKDRDTIERLSTTAEEARRLLSDTSEIDRLREEISTLNKSYEAEVSKVSKLQETMSIEAEKREKERKQGAEVRDRLVRQLEELECFRKDLPVAREQAQQQYQAADVARNEARNTQRKLDQALLAAKEHEDGHAKVSKELEQALVISKEHRTRKEELTAELDSALLAIKKHETLYQEVSAELDTTRDESANNKTRRLSNSLKVSEITQELDALQIIADEERDKNDKLRSKLAEITVTAEAHATRVREMEAALKVTTAELTEMRTKRTNGRDFTPTRSSKKSGRTSLWTAESNDDGFVEVTGIPDGEELGSSIEGTMAGIQEQIRQLEEVNEDMMGESQRLVNMLSRATSPKTSLPLESTNP